MSAKDCGINNMPTPCQTNFCEKGRTKTYKCAGEGNKILRCDGDTSYCGSDEDCVGSESVVSKSDLCQKK